MFVQIFITLTAAVHELSCYVDGKKLSDDAENNTAVAKIPRTVIIQFGMQLLSRCYAAVSLSNY